MGLFYRIGSVLVCLFLIFLGCSRVKPHSQSTEGGEGILPGENVPVVNIFPHPEGWSDPFVHGASAQQVGSNLCLECHQEGSATPSCSSCHALFPHQENWGQGDVHGAYVLASGKSSCETQCHGTDLQGGLSGVSCNSCHDIYPHSSAWANADQHGSKAEWDGKQLCTSCHGDDYLGATSGVSCYQCHSLYPHSANWADPTNHGQMVITNGTSTCETQCHGSDLQGGLSEVSCNSCHSLYPHATAWETYEGHGVYTLAHSITDCQACHGTNYQGGANGSPSCYSCHTTYPHLSGWSEPSQHGVWAYGDGKTSCATAHCHGVNYEGNEPTVPSCFSSSCHADYPHTNPNWVAGAASVHALTFIEKIGNGESNACTECHGTDYNRNVGGTTCLSCHPDGVTHTTNWSQGAGHGRYYSDHYTAFSTEAGCYDCHGVAVNFNNAQTKESLASQSLCYSCHWAYPHIGWVWDWGGDIGSWDTSDDEGWAHAIYVFGSGPLFVDESNYHPTNAELMNCSLGDDTNKCFNAAQNTCGGGTGGSCHNGTRAGTPADYPSNAICSMCHP